MSHTSSHEFLDWQPAWLNLQYQKTPLPIRPNNEYVSMLFHIHSPWSYVCLGPCHERLTHTASLVGYLKRLANYTAFCLSLQKAQRSLVGVWPDVFPVVLYCRMWWRELCPMVVVLARTPLTRWLRRWNMLIKLKTTSKNLHQIVTLVVSGATVRFIYGETSTCWHSCYSVYLCVYVCVRWYLCVVCASWICVMRPASWCRYFMSDCLTRTVISAVYLWQSLNSLLLWQNHLCMHYLSYSIFPSCKGKKQAITYLFCIF